MRLPDPHPVNEAVLDAGTYDGSASRTVIAPAGIVGGSVFCHHRICTERS